MNDHWIWKSEKIENIGEKEEEADVESNNEKHTDRTSQVNRQSMDNVSVYSETCL